jgi:hypothetical protein
MRRGLKGTVCVMTLLAATVVPMRGSGFDAAVVAKDQMCGVMDGDGGFSGGLDSLTVTTSSGVTTVLCKVKRVPNSTGRSVYWGFENTGIECGTEFGSTQDWQEHISASGNATLACHFKSS